MDTTKPRKVMKPKDLPLFLGAWALFFAIHYSMIAGVKTGGDLVTSAAFLSCIPAFISVAAVLGYRQTILRREHYRRLWRRMEAADTRRRNAELELSETNRLLAMYQDRYDAPHTAVRSER